MQFLFSLLFWLFLSRTSTLSHTIYLCGLRFYISVLVILSISFRLRRLIYSQSAMTGVINMMSRPNTSYLVKLYGRHVVPQNKLLLLYLTKDHTCLGTSELFWNSNVRMRLAVTWCIIFNIFFHLAIHHSRSLGFDTIFVFD